MREVSIEAEGARCNKHRMDRWRWRKNGKEEEERQQKGIMSKEVRTAGTERSRIPLAGSRHAAVLRCLVQETITAVFKQNRDGNACCSLNAGQPLSWSVTQRGIQHP